MSLEKDLVSAAGCVFPAEEPVVTDFVESRLRGKRRDVSADCHSRTLCPRDLHGSVPAHPAPKLAFEMFVAGIVRFVVDPDCVDVGSDKVPGQPHAVFAGVSLHGGQEISGAFPAPGIDQTVDGFEPFVCFLPVDVRNLA